MCQVGFLGVSRPLWQAPTPSTHEHPSPPATAQTPRRLPSKPWLTHVSRPWTSQVVVDGPIGWTYQQQRSKGLCLGFFFFNPPLGYKHYKNILDFTIIYKNTG